MKLTVGVCLVILIICRQVSAQDRLSCELLAGFSDLWKQAGYGRDMNATEKSAWIFQDSTFHKWPGASERMRDFWRGKIPEAAIAQAHVHPIVADPRPSTVDVATAKRIRMSIYTISRDAIWMVTSDGHVFQQSGSDWLTPKFCLP